MGNNENYIHSYGYFTNYGLKLYHIVISTKYNTVLIIEHSKILTKYCVLISNLTPGVSRAFYR